MNKTVIGIVAAVVIIGGGAYFLLGNQGTTPGSAVAPEGAAAPVGAGTQQPAAAPTGTPMSLKELLAGGTAQQCTFVDSVAGVATQGTVYVGSGKVRMDFSSTQQGKTTSGHTITDGNDFYTWSDGMKDGFKMNMTAAKSSGTQQQMIDADRKVDYHCSSWTADAAKFALPKDVTFRDMADMMKGVKIPATR